MPWKLETPMSQRKEFVSLAQTDGANLARLCRRFEVSRKIGYKWLARYREAGESGLADRSRRPHHSPRETQEALVAAVLAVRAAHPAWSGRKIRARLLAQGRKLGAGSGPRHDAPYLLSGIITCEFTGNSG